MGNHFQIAEHSRASIPDISNHRGKIDRATDHHWRPRAMAARQLPIIWLTVDKDTRIGPVRLLDDSLTKRCCPVGDNNGQRFFWAIDYYDETCTYRSRDPCDEFVTTRVLTLMLTQAIKLRSSELFLLFRTLTTGLELLFRELDRTYRSWNSDGGQNSIQISFQLSGIIYFTARPPNRGQ